MRNWRDPRWRDWATLVSLAVLVVVAVVLVAAL